MFAVERHLNLGLIFAICMAFLKFNNSLADVHLENKEQFDITSDLTDKELKLALNDLSLKDLNTLQEFIDSAKYKDFDYQNQWTSNTNDLNTQNLNNMIYYNPEQEDYNFEPLNNDKDLEDYITAQEDNQRAKRANEKPNINEDYIKQLDYSFPQTEQQNHNNKMYANDFKNPHVRVKRN